MANRKNYPKMWEQGTDKIEGEFPQEDPLTAKFMDQIMKKRFKMGLSAYPIDRSGNIVVPNKKDGRLLKATIKQLRSKNFDKLYD